LKLFAVCDLSQSKGSRNAHLFFAKFSAHVGQRLAMKRTYQPSKVRRSRTHGFLVRSRTRGGRAVLRARRAKGRARLSV